MSTQPETMREAFEAHATRDIAGLNNYLQAIMCNDDGRYIYAPLQKQWESWQAATALATAAQWMPIETAPKDGTQIIIAEIDDGVVYDLVNGHFEVLIEDEDDGPWGIQGGEPFCSYVGRAAGLYFCCWLPGKEYEPRWKLGPSFEYTHWMPLPPPPAIRAGEALEGGT